MAKQLIFCSVPHGLQPGRSGYCLVMGHNDLPQSLIRQLEQETSVFPENVDEDHAATYQIRKIGGTEWHVFLRQTTGIKDYTGRTSGLTHVIVENTKSFPRGLDPKTVLWSFKNWVTAIPDAPKIYGESEELDFAGYLRRKPAVTRVETVASPATVTHERFHLNTAAERERPAPRPRSGLHYDGPRRKSSKGWWIGLGVVAVVLVVVLVF